MLYFRAEQAFPINITGERMPKSTEGAFALGGLALLAAWLLVGLPLLYLPSETHAHGEILGVKYGEWLLFAATMGLWWATWRLVKSAEQTAQRQLRAYIGLEKGTVSNLGGTEKVDATMAFRNAGQTPAYKLHTWGGMSVRPYPGIVEIQSPKRDPARVRESLVVPNASFFRTETGEIPQDIKADIVAGRATLFVYGEVHYEDAFKRKRLYTYRLFCGGGHPHSITQKDGKIIGRLAPHETGNDEVEC
jgi:hypothetical protein